MSIRVKLVLAYIILLVISLIILFTSSVAITGRIIQYAADAVFTGDAKTVATQTIDIVADLKRTYEDDPNQLVAPNFIKTISEKTNFFNGGLLVKYDDRFYNYSSLPTEQAFYDNLNTNATHENSLSHNQKNGDNFEYNAVDYFYIQYDFLVDDGTAIYYFVADLSKLSAVKGRGGSGFLFILLGILMFIALPIIFIITFDIIKPIKKLESGVQKISQGDLDFVLSSKRHNELGRVIRSFETMRAKLKASIDTQIKYENNRKELISSISHDLKTPITSIKGYVAGIRDGVADTPEKRAKYLAVIDTKINEMDVLIDDLFMMSKLDLNKMTFNLSSIDYLAFIKNSVDTAALNWHSDKRKIKLTIDDAIHSARVMIDAKHFERVLSNIITNSKRYNDKEEALIYIRVLPQGDHAIKTIIADNGKGIAKAALPHVFESFYRADVARTSTDGGSGLGLAIAKQIVDSHGGTIDIASQIGIGTEVMITLPLDRS